MRLAGGSPGGRGTPRTDIAACEARGMRVGSVSRCGGGPSRPSGRVFGNGKKVSGFFDEKRPF